MLIISFDEQSWYSVCTLLPLLIGGPFDHREQNIQVENTNIQNVYIFHINLIFSVDQWEIKTSWTNIS